MYLRIREGLGQPARETDSEARLLRQVLAKGLKFQAEIEGKVRNFNLAADVARSPYVPKRHPECREYWALPPDERAKVAETVSRVFRTGTGIARGLDQKNPKDRPWIRIWLTLRDQVMALRSGAAPIDCANQWQAYVTRALDVTGQAKPTDHRLRNMLITAHYALLYLGNREFKWAGFAAYASKQVGCAMDHSQRIARLALSAGTYYPMKQNDEEALDSWDKLGVSLGGYGAAELANYMYAKLGEGNQKLFLDIFPAHLFFIDHGYQRMAKCATTRKPPLPSELLEGFRLIEASRNSAQAAELLKESVAAMARHEQLNVLQPAIYDDQKIRAILDLNELDVPGADPAKAILTRGCDDPGEHNTYYLNDTGRGDKKLYDPKHRMEWILGRIAPHYFAIEGTARHIEDMKALTSILYH